MATTFTIRTSRKSGDATIIARVQRPEYRMDIRVATGLKADIEKWSNAKNSTKSLQNYRRDNKSLFEKLDEVEQSLDDASKAGTLTCGEAREIIESIVNREAREQQAKDKEEKKRKEEESKRVTFMQFYRQFVNGIEKNEVTSNKNIEYAEQTRKNYNTTLHKLERYEKNRNIALDWDDIDMDFFDDFNKYLRKEGAKQNSIAKHIRCIKTVVHRAYNKGRTTNMVFMNTDFRVSEVDIDAVYLTREEVDAIKKVDLSELSQGHEWARDLFLVGILTAQRVSDYSNIKPENIKTEIQKRIVEDENGEDRIERVEKVYIILTQKKTGVTVSIPANKELREILAKYNNNLPQLSEQKLNAYIKEIARLAKITDTITIKSIKGGKEVIEQYEKCDLIRSHTARRTGCTWMYLAGINETDICRISGHQSTQ